MQQESGLSGTHYCLDALAEEDQAVARVVAQARTGPQRVGQFLLVQVVNTHHQLIHVGIHHALQAKRRSPRSVSFVTLLHRHPLHM